MKHTYLLILIILSTILLLSGCKTSTESEEPAPVFPMYVDDNGNDINDYVEQETHESGPDISTSTTGPSSTPGGAPGHSFIDSDDDGICDYAQDGTPTWHSPGFIDDNDNGICDFWDESHPMHSRHDGMRFHDENGNHINDYFEEEPHRSGDHDFIDEKEDGICDYAQDGSPSWHGPGFIDRNQNGMSDHWENGGRGHGGMMGGGHH
ncbi:hypothetical protein CK503_02470 [Aliifodinibius salipaludis]|uniref:Lipoprotein n=1 Tax=Fodinibius salipaludis TaxID=2032627 RepID=A0A2A2GDW4_9BACT|nr:hypothetical protein [Aliifodinibius salipaludis]PAU95083.1 hypothetical protein CK503_02470 [Aliifodinibius salipaludis]